jgi:hypothetical protein
MIENNQNIIMVCGMAHSGTTLLTHFIRQNPDTYNYVNGISSWVYETQLIIQKSAKKISGIINSNPNKKILMKSPWSEVEYSDWLIENMPDACYVCCLKNFDDIKTSWSNIAAQVNDELKFSNDDFKKQKYDFCISQMNKFKNCVKKFIIINYKDLINNPSDIMDKIENLSDIKPYKYDFSIIGQNKSIKEIIWHGDFYSTHDNPKTINKKIYYFI